MTTWMSQPTAQQRRCLRCGHEWPATGARTPSCPACGSARWDQDLQVGARNTYEIRQVAARTDDSVTLELKLRNAGHMPNPTLDGELLRSLKARAENLGVPIAGMIGFSIEFERSPTGRWSIMNIESPRELG
jgi:hypothetical protein